MDEELKSYLAGMENRLDSRLTGMDSRLASMDNRLAGVETNMAAMEVRLKEYVDERTHDAETRLLRAFSDSIPT